MDKESTSEKRRTVFEGAWENSVSEMITRYLQEDLLHVVHMLTPYGINTRKYQFVKITSLKDNQRYLKLMTAYVRRTSRRGLSFGLEQRLPGKIKNPDLVNMKPEFSYKWYKNGDGVLIRKYLASKKPRVIKKQAKLLFNEAQNFFYPNCMDDAMLEKFVSHKKYEDSQIQTTEATSELSF